MSVADRLGLGPTREVQTHTDGSGYTIRVTSPPLFGSQVNEVFLTKHQYIRYLQWRDRKGLIQDLLPDLSDQCREILMSGIADLESRFPEDE